MQWKKPFDGILPNWKLRKPSNLKIGRGEGRIGWRFKQHERRRKRRQKKKKKVKKKKKKKVKKKRKRKKKKKQQQQQLGR